uniref:C2 domain-containing protein n=1 Tax=Amphora coffeiformis TaxID=265554 RepID=A0A7S3P819_9STRA|mmetsp:Transcript_17836/g.33600  ORF Transcript_17836/g.33600 Transcript_17836/m.33600 type:complete len:150 (+) Transcript_17836:140-589(+)|eukprot:scaffold2109_cov188-Amphora_coffeaeformis.AAC.11
MPTITSSLDCHLHLLQGRNLSVQDLTSSDPFVRVYLGSNNQADNDDYLFQSRSKSQTVNPKFNEKFRITITDPDLVARILQSNDGAGGSFLLRIYDEDGMHGEDSMGYVQVPIIVDSNNNEESTTTTCEWYAVQDGQGELQVKLQVTVV